MYEDHYMNEWINLITWAKHELDHCADDIEAL